MYLLTSLDGYIHTCTAIRPPGIRNPILEFTNGIAHPVVRVLACVLACGAYLVEGRHAAMTTATTRTSEPGRQRTSRAINDSEERIKKERIRNAHMRPPSKGIGT